ALEDVGLQKGAPQWGAKINRMLQCLQGETFENGLTVELTEKWQQFRPMQWKIVRSAVREEAVPPAADAGPTMQSRFIPTVLVSALQEGIITGRQYDALRSLRHRLTGDSVAS